MVEVGTATSERLRRGSSYANQRNHFVACSEASGRHDLTRFTQGRGGLLGRKTRSTAGR